LFFSTLCVASAASLIVMKPSEVPSAADAISTEQLSSNAQKISDAKYAKLLQQAKDAIEQKDGALKQIRDELLVGYVVSKDIEVTDSNRAYWLAEPKLMLGVNSLAGGTLQVYFADKSERISVGGRIEFKVDDCDCFILLKSSRYGVANFRFACTPARMDTRQEQYSAVIDARLN
jgi:hypothetical protein